MSAFWHFSGLMTNVFSTPGLLAKRALLDSCSGQRCQAQLLAGHVQASAGAMQIRVAGRHSHRNAEHQCVTALSDP